MGISPQRAGSARRSKETIGAVKRRKSADFQLSHPFRKVPRARLRRRASPDKDQREVCRISSPRCRTAGIADRRQVGLACGKQTQDRYTAQGETVSRARRLAAERSGSPGRLGKTADCGVVLKVEKIFAYAKLSGNFKYADPPCAFGRTGAFLCRKQEI